MILPHEVAVLVQLADQRIDLAQPERRRRVAFEVGLHGQRAGVERDLRSALDGDHTVALRESVA